MDTALDLPPALFDLEQPTPPGVLIRRRPGHGIRIDGPHAACECGVRTMHGDPAQLERWVYNHLGIAYDTTIHQAATA